MQPQLTFPPEAFAVKQTIILGVYFMLTYLTFLSFSNILTYINEHQQGQYSYSSIIALAVNYFIYLVTLIFTPMITNFKRMFQISAICHLVNYAVYIPNLKQEWGLLMGIIGAVFGGYGAAIYWVSQGGYMMKLFRFCSISSSQEGKYFAIINGIVYCSALFGALVTTFGLGFFGSEVYFVILSFLALLSWVVCTFLLDSLDNKPLDSFNNQSLAQGNSSLLSESNHSIEQESTDIQFQG